MNRRLGKPLDRPWAVVADGLAPYLLCLLLMGMAGCARVLPELEPYGAVKGVDANRSENGLGVYRKMWETAGAKCLFPQKLSPKLDSFDVIVLVGNSYSPPGKKARAWLEDWLRQEDGRTIIYFGRDFNADLYYRERTVDGLPEEEISRAELALANVQVSEMNERLRQLPESTFCRWFFLDTSLERKDYSHFQGPWADDLSAKPGTWPVGVTLQEPDRSYQSRKPSWLTNKTKNALKPASQFVPAEKSGDAAVQRSRWFAGELDSDQAWDKEFEDLWKSEILLASDDGRPLVFRLSDSKRLRRSQILIVANGAPLLNASLVDPLHRTIGSKLIEQCLPAERVALLSYGEQGLLISSAAETDLRVVGLEVLTVWPLSAITMPAALLGIVICAALLPILGRAQPLPKRSVTDFGLHVEALGRMLLDSGDVDYAKGVIDEYFRKVRGESPPTWLESVAGAAPSTRTLVVGSSSEGAAGPLSGERDESLSVAAQRTTAETSAGAASMAKRTSDSQTFGQGGAVQSDPRENPSG